MSTNKKELNELIEQLSDKDISLLTDLAKKLIHPEDYFIPYDDEPLTEDDVKAIEEGHKEYLEGKTIPFEEILHMHLFVN